MATVPSGTVYLGKAGFKRMPLANKWNRPFLLNITYDSDTSTRQLTNSETENLARSPEPVLTGINSLRYTWNEGVDGDGGTGPGGGIFDYGNRVEIGETCWFMIHVHYPEDYSWGFKNLTGPGAGGATKFMRIRTYRPARPGDDPEQVTNGEFSLGYNDIYVEMRNNRMFFTYEGTKQRVDFPLNSGLPTNDGWQSFQVVLTLDTEPVTNNGLAKLLFYKNGVLIHTVNNLATLVTPDAYARVVHYNTYWNGLTPQTQTCHLDNILWTNIPPTTTDSAGNLRYESLTDA